MRTYRTRNPNETHRSGNVLSGFMRHYAGQAGGDCKIRHHNKLRAFDLADRLTAAIYGVTARFPHEEMFGLSAQLRRAAVSIASNIVEGSARSSQSDYIHLLNITNAAARELEYQVGLAACLGFLNDISYDKLTALCAETSKVLNGLLRSLRGL